MTPDREWRRIPGHPDYSVSDQGDVWSGKSGRLIGVNSVDSEGYRPVNLDGKCKRIHSLVLLAFVGPRPQGLVTRHLDGNPLNNALSNLKYGTESENLADSRRHGTRPPVSQCMRGHELDAETAYIGADGRHRCRTCRRISIRDEGIRRQVIRDVEALREQIRALECQVAEILEDLSPAQRSA